MRTKHFLTLKRRIKRVTLEKQRSNDSRTVECKLDRTYTRHNEQRTDSRRLIEQWKNEKLLKTKGE